MARITYKKCPRCELNYIDSRKEMCDVCKTELNLRFDLNEDEDELEKELCPLCKIRYISLDEEICETCATEKVENDVVEDDSWRNFIDEEQDGSQEGEEMEIPLEELQDEEFGEVFDDEEEETYSDEPDDFEAYGDLDDIDFEGEDDEDDEDYDEDDD